MAQQRKTGTRRGAGKPKPRRMLATLPDAVGAQSVIVVAGTQAKPVLALLLLKIGEGVKDAMVIPCRDRNDASAIIQEYQPLAPHELPLELGRTLIAAALHEGAPAQDWPEAARRVGLDDLTARACTGRDWLSVLDADGDTLTTATQERRDAGRAALAGATNWAERHPIVGTWQEDPACLIDAGADPNADRRELYDYVLPAIERSRALWQEILLRAAVVLRHAHDDWFGLALSALVFDEATDVRSIPVAQLIADVTARSFQDNPHGQPDDASAEAHGGSVVSPGPPAEPGELERLLAQAGVEADVTWLDGYLTACELAPEPTNQQVWANDLIAQGEIRGDLDAAKRLLDLALQRFETLLDALEDPQAIRDSVDRVSQADLATWARGFVAATERIPGAWPADSLRPTDRTWLDALTALARHGTTPADRAGLAGWLTERAEITAQPDS